MRIGTETKQNPLDQQTSPNQIGGWNNHFEMQLNCANPYYIKWELVWWKEEVWPHNLHVKFQISPNEAACLQDIEATEPLVPITVFMGQYVLHL